MNALRIFTTAGTDAKLEFCKTLGATHTINYKSGPFLEKVLRDTEKRGALIEVIFIVAIWQTWYTLLGVNVVLDFIGADYLQQNIDALKVDGKTMPCVVTHNVTHRCRHIGDPRIFGRHQRTELQHGLNPREAIDCQGIHFA